MPLENTSTRTSRSRRVRKKYFTHEESNRAIIYISRVVGDITDVYQFIIDLRHQLEDAEPGRNADRLELDYERAMDRLSELVDELHLAGVELKDFEKGCVDFPARLSHREVVLSWCKGEDQVAHWHEVDEDFSCRQPVGLLFASAAL